MMLTTLLLFVPFWTDILTQKGVCFMLVTSINWRVLISYGSVAHDNFLTCVMQNGLTQVVDCPTHGSNCICFSPKSSL